MRKVLLLIAVSFVSTMLAYAQNYAVLHIEEISGGSSNIEFHYCTPDYDGVVIYAQPGCSNFEWIVDYSYHYYNLDSVVISTTEFPEFCSVHYGGCGLSVGMSIWFHGSNIQNPFAEPFVWKRQGESITLSVEENYDYEWLWSNGSTDYQIEITTPGTYSVTITSIYGCGSETYSIQVRDNVEISLATCDLESNLNMVTWPTTVAQAEYVDHLNVKRDGMTVATANYSDGFFLDNIGSDAAPRTYSLVAVGTDGTDCPIESYPKETIHMSYLLGVGNTVEVGWNQPSGYDLLGYNICEWNPNDKDGDLTVIDFVGAGVTSYTCQASQFDNGNIVVQGVEAGKDSETRLLSNRSIDIVGLGENEAMAFKVYPNPTKDRFTVEGSGKMIVTNTLGQTILTREIDGKATIELPQGLYFVKMNGITRKVVVE